MTIELVRRLYHGGVVDAESLEAALLDTIHQGVPFVQALAARCAPRFELMDREIERIVGFAVDDVRPDPALVAALPEGMCERLLAAPLGRDPSTDEVTVAAVDPLDPHVAEEFGYHLDAPIVVVPALRRVVQVALGKLAFRRSTFPSDPDCGGQHEDTQPGVAPPPAVGVMAPGVVAETETSDPPIPLVRRSLVPQFDSETRPGVGGPSPRFMSRPGAAGDELASLSSSSSRSTTGSDNPSIEPILEGLEWATQPDDVVRQVIGGLAPFALQVAVFAESGGVHRGRAASASLGGASAARAVEQEASEDCVLDRAVTDGSYFGLLIPRVANESIARLLGRHLGEVYAVPVLVSGRPALVILLASLTASALATRRADELAKAASAALERIVRARKGQ